MNNLKSIECNLSNLGYILKGLENGNVKVNPEGSIATLSPEQAKAALDRLTNSPDKPDCSELGYAKHIFNTIVNDQQLDSLAKKKILIQAWNQKQYKNVLNILDICTPEELESMGAAKIIQKMVPAKVFFYFDVLKKVETAIESGRNAYDEHNSRCTGYNASLELIAQGSKEAIGKVTFKSPAAIGAGSLPFPSLPKSLPLPLPNASGNPALYKVRPRPSVVTTPLPPLASAPQKSEEKVQNNPQPVAESPQVNFGANFNPLNPRDSAVSAVINGGYGQVGISVSPLNPKHINASASISGVNVGAQISLKNPLKSKFVVNVPVAVPVIPIPITIGLDGQLNRLHKLKFKLEIPLDPVDKLVSCIGIKCPPSVPIIQIKVKKIVKPIKKVIFGKKHKHKDKPLVDPSKIFKQKISLVNQAQNTPLPPELIAACQRNVEELIALNNASQNLEHEVTLVLKNQKELDQMIKETNASIQALENEVEVARKNATAIQAGYSLEAAVIRGENQLQLGAQLKANRQSQTPQLINALESKITPEEVAKLQALSQALG